MNPFQAFFVVFVAIAALASAQDVDPETAAAIHDKIFGGATGNPCAFKKCPAYTLISSCSSQPTMIGSLASNASYMGDLELSFDGRLEVTTLPESYTGPYEVPAEHQDKMFGHSRILIDVHVNGAHSYPTNKHVTLNTGTCENKGPIYHEYNKADDEYGTFDDDLVDLPEAPEQDEAGVKPHQGGTEHPKFHPNYLQYVDVHNFIAKYYHINSMTLTLTYDLDGPVSFSECCEMNPVFPDFPDNWTADIEYTIIDKKYTSARREFYSASAQKVRIDEHSHQHRMVQIEDIPAQTKYTIARNSTYPHGLCQAHAFGTFDTSTYVEMGEDKMPHLTGTADLLLQADSSLFDHVHEDDLKTVRGIPSNRWKYNMTTAMADVSTMPGEPACTEGSHYQLQYYFPTPEWQVRNEHYHRLLNRIRMAGTECHGHPVAHYYDFVNFRPYIEDAETFNPCKVFEGGVVGCDCENQSDVSAPTAADDADDDDDTSTDDDDYTSTDAQGGAKYLAYFDDKIHVTKKAANGVTVLLFFFGLLVGFAVTVIYFKKAVGVKLGDNFKAQNMGGKDVEMSGNRF